MAFSDWEGFKNGATARFEVDLAQPIEGLQSLKLGQTSGITYVNAIPTVASGFTQGLTAGRIRTLIDKKTLSTNSHYFGICCMQSARDISSSGAFYSVRIQNNGNVGIAKTTSGGLPANPTTLTSTTLSPNPPSDEVFAIELMWFYDLAQFSGTRLEFRFDTSGSVTDFSGIDAKAASPDLLINDTSTPLSTSLGEGLYTRDAGSGGNIEILFDQTTFYSVAFV